MAGGGGGGEKIRLHAVKPVGGEAGAWLVRETWKLKNLQQVAVDEKPAGDGDPRFTLIFSVGGKVSWLARDRAELRQIVGGLLQLCRHYQGELPGLRGLVLADLPGFGVAGGPVKGSRSRGGSGALRAPPGPREGTEGAAGGGTGSAGGEGGGDAAGPATVGPPSPERSALISQQDEEHFLRLMRQLDILPSGGPGSAGGGPGPGTDAGPGPSLEEISARLQDELEGLEAANAHAVMESGAEVRGVLGQIDESLGYVDDLDEWLKVFSAKLNHMRVDIETIEERNNALELQASNNAALLSELKALDAILQIPRDVAETLLHHPFSYGLPDVVGAARQLHAMCHRVGLCPRQVTGGGEAEPFPTPLPEKLQAIRAVKEHQADLRRLRSTWLSRAKESLGGMFLKAAEQVLGSMSGQQALNLMALHEHLDSCRPLLQVMHLVDPTSLHAVRSLYTQALNPLICRHVRLLFAPLRKPPAGEAIEDPAPSGGGEEAEARLRQSLGEPAEVFFSRALGVLVAELAHECHVCLVNLHQVPLGIPSGSEIPEEEKLDFIDTLYSAIDGLEDELTRAVGIVVRDAMHIPGVLANLSLWIAWLDDKPASTHLVEILTSCRTEARGLLQESVQSELASIKREGEAQTPLSQAGVPVPLGAPTVKKIGVLPYISRFPRFVSRMVGAAQSMFDPLSRDQAAAFEADASMRERPKGYLQDCAKESYGVLVRAMFDNMEVLAASEPKKVHGFRLLFENYAFFQERVSIFAAGSPTLEAFCLQAEARSKQVMARYMEEMFEWSAFGPILKLSAKLDQMLVDIPAGEIAFHLGFSPQEVNEAIHSSFGRGRESMIKRINMMHERIVKHLGLDTPLANRVEREMKEQLISRIARHREQLQTCFGDRCVVPLEHLKQAANLF